MRLLIMGPPGVGKGTQACSIAAHYRIPAISTGSIFRTHVTNQTPLGRQVSEILAAGSYVPDEITNAIVSDRIHQPDAVSGWLLDGYPRTIGQVESLDSILEVDGAALDAVVSLTADADLLVDRLLKRAELEGRADDNAETIRHRMNVYNTATDPLLDTYRERGILVEVDGIGLIEEVAYRVTRALDAKLS
jgi:adenylate kinase